MSKKSWIDVSIDIKNGMAGWPGDPQVKMSLFASMEEGKVCNVTQIFMSAHTGTHMDGLNHFIKGGTPIDQMPLDAVIGPVRVIEVKDKESIKPQHLKGKRLKKGERILFKTINSTKIGKDDKFFEDFVYISKEAAKVIADAGVQTVGTDYLSVGGFKKDGVETHHALLGPGVWVIEGLDLSKIKPGRYDMICLPIKIKGCDGAPARALLKPR